MGDVERSHRPGHIGSTPQDTNTILVSSRIAGILAGVRDRIGYWPFRSVDATMGRPAVAADPGYFRDDWTAAQITGSVQRSALNGGRQFINPNHIGAATGDDTL